MSILVRAQAPQDAAGAPADQQPVPQVPAQQQPVPPQQPPSEITPQPETRRLKLPPAPPKVVDVRMPGEAGWNIGLTGWLPMGDLWVDKGKDVSFTAPSKLQLAGKSKGAFGADFGVAAGLHNTLRFTYFFAKRSGTTTAPNDLVIFSQPYYKGDELTTNGKLSDYKLSYEYLTWPYPVEGRHFRLKTLWQVQYINLRTVYDAPIKSSTPDSSGALTDYSTLGSKGFITPAFGLGVQQYATRNIRFEANISGFWLPHRWHLLDTDATIAYRFLHLELRGGVKGFIFRTSPKSDYFYRGTLGGAFVGLRWYSD
ncbi:MAG: hypothetical protein NTW28_24255 [Candidatus Solibacter sp.]|nr:hypothetical protein [Candidatus Solibacter sp.]